jgi:hypothetical protein
MQVNEKAFNKLDPMETKNVIVDLAHKQDIEFLSKKLFERIKTTDHDHQFKKTE